MSTPDFNDILLKILLVEDTPESVLMIKEHLKSSKSKYSISTTSTLSDALQLIIEQSFDVILLDLDLPDSIGLKTLQTLRIAEATIPILVIADHDDEEVALSSVREGAQDYLPKNKLTAENILRAIKLGIERKNILKILRKHTRQFSILSAAIAEINECENILSVYQTFCHYVQTLMKDTIIIPVDFVDQNVAYVLSHERIGKYFKQDRVKGIIKEHASTHITDILREVIQLFQDGKLHKMPKDILEMFSVKYGLSFTPELQNRLLKDEAYTIGFLKSEQYFGGVILFTQKMIEPIHVEIIETIGSQVSLNIHKKTVENILKVSEKRYRALFSEVKNAKEELQSLNDDLEMKIQFRTTELVETNSLLKTELEERKRIEEKLKKYAANLKELNATKDKFFGIIAHDLKNPFTSLLGASELLINYVDKFDTDNIKSISNLLNDSAKRGYALLENLLEWSRTQTGDIKFNPEKYDIGELITDSLNAIELPRVNKKIKLSYQIPEGVQAAVDRKMFSTIMRNLLGNAIKFTHRGGQVTVKCESLTDHMMISVKDTGIGIPEKDITKLFRIDIKYTGVGTSKERGTGLGLLLCKEFVQKHCGKIWVESTEGEGSEFKFTIPNSIPTSQKDDTRKNVSHVREKKEM